MLLVKFNDFESSTILKFNLSIVWANIGLFCNEEEDIQKLRVL